MVVSGCQPAGRQVFISYAREDGHEFARHLKTDLQRVGYRVWIDEDELMPTEHWDTKIEEAISRSSWFVAVLTAHSVRKTSVCRDEILFAVDRNKDVITLRVDAMVKPTLFLARRHWIDFTRDYDQALSTFLRYLAGDRSAPRPPLLPSVTGMRPFDSVPEIARYYDPRFFAGREWVARELEHWLARESNKMMVILGDPGVGKSTIAAWLASTRADVVGIHFCTHRDLRTLSLPELVASLVSQLHAALQGFAEAIDRKEPAALRENAEVAFRELVVEPVRTLPRGQPRLVIIDALDEAVVGTGKTQLPRLLCEQAGDLIPWLRILATTRPDARILACLQDQHLFELKAQGSDNLGDLKEYIDARLYRERSSEHLQPCAASLRSPLEKLAEGNFLYAKLALDALEDGKLKVEDLNVLSPGLADFYWAIFGRLFQNTDEYANSYASLLRVLVAARAPLPLSLLQEVCGDTAEAVYRRLLVLSPYLRKHPSESGEAYSLFHKSLQEWLTWSGAAQYWVCEQDGHQLLADFGWEEFSTHPSTMSGYNKGHLAFHLMKLSRWTELLALLASPELGLVERWAEHGDEEGVECLKSLKEHGELKPVHQAAVAAQIARIRSHRGEYEKAERELEYALGRTSWSRGRRTRAIALHELGSLYLYRRERTSAKQAYHEALRVCVWGLPKYRDEAAANRIGLATVACQEYDWHSAIRLAQKACREAESVPDVRHAVAAERLVAFAAESLGEYEEAHSILRAALERSERHGIELESTRVLGLLGCYSYCQAMLGGQSCAQARGYFGRALDGAKRLNNLYSILDAKLRLGWCELADRSGGKAVRLFEEVRTALPANRHPELAVGVCLGMAAAKHQLGRLEEAAAEYQIAAAWAAEFDFRGYRTMALIGHGAVHWHQGRNQEGEAIWQEARECARTDSPRGQQLVEVSIRSCRSEPTATPL